MEISFSKLKEDEREYFLEVARSNFNFVQKFFLGLEDDVLVAKKKGKILGGVVIKKTDLGFKKIGVISWIFTVKEARGKGIASRLLDKAVEHLKFLGHDEIVASVDGSNTSSSKLFEKKNFVIQSFYSQLKKYGVGYFNLASKTNQFFNQGSFIWVLSKEKVRENKYYDLGFSIFINFLAGLILFYSPINYIFNASLLVIMISIFLLHFVRFFSMKLASKVLNYKSVFRSWPSGFLTSLIGSGFGLYIASPGNFFPLDKGWKYKDYVPSLSKISSIGVSSVLAVVLISIILQSVVISPFFVSLFQSIKYLGLSLVVFDLFLFFKPFNNTNGKRIFDFNKTIFAILALIVIIAFIL
ncbi:MAG: GNAT family N-acetyltransferase [Candidatus Woesearchaeota archaeon]